MQTYEGAMREYFNLQRKLETAKAECDKCIKNIIFAFCPYYVGQRVLVHSHFTNSPFEATIINIYHNCHTGIDGKWGLIIETQYGALRQTLNALNVSSVESITQEAKPQEGMGE